MSRSDHETEKPQPAGPPVGGPGSSLKAAGLAIAWIGGVVCGWRVFLDSNLLDAVLRGAAAWFALTVLWMVGISFCQRYVFSAEGSSPSAVGAGTTPAEAGGETQP